MSPQCPYKSFGGLLACSNPLNGNRRLLRLEPGHADPIPGKGSGSAGLESRPPRLSCNSTSDQVEHAGNRGWIHSKLDGAIELGPAVFVDSSFGLGVNVHILLALGDSHKRPAGMRESVPN